MAAGNRGEAQITVSQAASCPRHPSVGCAGAARYLAPPEACAMPLVCKVTLRVMRHQERVKAKLQKVSSFSVLFSQEIGRAHV